MSTCLSAIKIRFFFQPLLFISVVPAFFQWTSFFHFKHSCKHPASLHSYCTIGHFIVILSYMPCMHAHLCMQRDVRMAHRESPLKFSMTEVCLEMINFQILFQAPNICLTNCCTVPLQYFCKLGYLERLALSSWLECSIYLGKCSEHDI